MAFAETLKTLYSVYRKLGNYDEAVKAVEYANQVIKEFYGENDINYIYDMMLNGNYRGREIEQATTTYLKVKFIKAMLEQGDSNGKEEVESS